MFVAVTLSAIETLQSAMQCLCCCDFEYSDNTSDSQTVFVLL